MLKLKFFININKDLIDPSYYMTMVGILIYFVYTCLDISYAIGIISKYMSWLQSFKEPKKSSATLLAQKLMESYTQKKNFKSLAILTKIRLEI